MLYLYFALSLMFVAIGYLITEANAKYLLAGYNTLSEEERRAVALRPYLAYFRKFHLFLGVSFLLVGLALTYLVGERAGGWFMVGYPVLAYAYFIWRGAARRYG
jgi:hypothetical protein